MYHEDSWGLNIVTIIIDFICICHSEDFKTNGIVSEIHNILLSKFRKWKF